MDRVSNASFFCVINTKQNKTRHTQNLFIEVRYTYIKAPVSTDVRNLYTPSDSAQLNKCFQMNWPSENMITAMVMVLLLRRKSLTEGQKQVENSN